MEEMEASAGKIEKKTVPPVNVPIPTKIGSEMGGAPKTPTWDSKTVLTHGQMAVG